MKDRSADMLCGSSWRVILQFSFPLVIGNLIQQLYGFTDGLIASRFICPDALGSVGASSSIQFLVIGFCIGTCVGLSIPIAHATGAGNREARKDWIVNSIAVAAALALVSAVVFCAITDGLLALLRTPPELYDRAKRYLIILFAGLPCTIAFQLGAGILRAVGNSELPFRYLTISAAVNILLDLVFVAALSLGVGGAALATVAAQGLGAILCFRSVFSLRLIRKQDLQRSKVRLDACIKLLSVSIPIGLQYSITAIGTVVVQAANNALGSIYTTAFSAGSRTRQLFMCPFDAIATGASVFVAQNQGAGAYDRVQRGIRSGVLLGVGYGVLGGVILLLGANRFAEWFVGDSVAQMHAAVVFYLHRIGVAMWLLGVLNVCRMCVQGMGYTWAAMGAGLVELVSRLLLCWFWVPHYGFRAICANEPFAWVCASVYILLVTGIIIKYKRGKQ